MSASPSSSPGGVKLATDLGTIFAGLAIVVPLAAAAVIAIRHAFRAPTTVYNQYNDARRRTRATIVSDRVLPELASLVVTVNARAIQDGLVPQDANEETIADTLVSVGYMESLSRLSELYADYSDVERYEHDVVTWARITGVAAGVFLIAFVTVVAWLVLKGLTLEGWIILVAALALGGLIVAVTCWLQGTLMHNRMTRIFRKYE